jgi:hypothetical protein
MESISVAEICRFRGMTAEAMERTDVVMRGAKLSQSVESDACRGYSLSLLSLSVRFLDWDWRSLYFGTRRHIRRKSAALIFPPLDFGRGRVRCGRGITTGCWKAENGDVRH